MRRLQNWIANTYNFRFTGYFMMGAGILVLLVLAAIPPAWEYSNSPGFCGTTCHTMPPAFATYEESPHSNVLCVDCHIGRDLILIQASRKVEHSRLVWATIMDDFEYPIQTSSMRPARQTCEHCHNPEKFSDDSVRIVEHAENDRGNSLYSTYLLMHTGGGDERTGIARGIHWHIENEVSYIALDDREQDIPWVQVTYDDGTVVEYNALNSPIDTENLDQYEIHEMDCITCHNRISHLIDNPIDAVDAALHDGAISTDIPFIRARSVELLSEEYASTEDAYVALETLDEYYEENYPEFYTDNSDLVLTAIDFLKDLYDDRTFPEQELDWTTHPNNIGHRESPGCFRCHDGQHLNEAQEAIRLECNLCHSVPQVIRPTDIEPAIPLATGIEPESHLDSTWISRHHVAFDATCANCHTVANPGGFDDSSFCSNSACHGASWKYAGFDAPGLATTLGIFPVVAEPLLEDFEGEPTYEILQPLFNQQCSACHGEVPSNELRVTDYASIMAGSVNGPVIVPGSPEESRIVEVLQAGHFAELTDHQKELLIEWITDGAPET